MRQIDATTLKLEGMPIASIFGIPLVLRLDVNHDGHRGLVVLINDVRNSIPAGTTIVTVTARLRDGTELAGTDHVRVVRHRRRKRTRAPKHSA